ncbi:AAA family ATPase [Amycolatopsis silviterrae]|uniref:AAA family ATPase n=1 Tax=Amycolatopsis silviterrae TaxID=1656914 RepID=A0ABW5HF64_9PSEU
MVGQKLQRVTIEGFTSIRSATVDLGNINVLVGANGAGKSNFIQALGLLGRIVDRELGLFVGLNGGASALMNKSDDANLIHLELDADPNSYEAQLVGSADDELIFYREVIYFHRPEYDRRYDEVLGSGHRETRLVKKAEERPGRVASHVIDLLKGCKVFHFHDTSANAPVKRFSPTADNIALARDAGNLAAYLFRLQESENKTERAAFRRITGAIKLVAPFFREFVLRPENDRIRLRWRQTDSEAVFSANQMSDGTLRFVCLATLLLQPELPALVVLDEPELGLHPFAIVQLADLLRQAAKGSQVLIATQSVTLMNQFAVTDLIVVERDAGATSFSRPDENALREWLADYSLGELWEMNLLGGRPSREEPSAE